eukprot:NODE_5784_length_638_cov_6.699491_g5389_i0.p1 GENE.NODE_5784_length_638_cov_6.699491_g5389_i0~~NODE_5784_length_638_cov_6.699491_g5389_i0.p1  ORF type:complete len:109 (+),score=9.55 NODE_5784_length_638_cov_6.699491_g5389_i0:218-544(+)
MTHFSSKHRSSCRKCREKKGNEREGEGGKKGVKKGRKRADSFLNEGVLLVLHRPDPSPLAWGVLNVLHALVAQHARRSVALEHLKKVLRMIKRSALVVLHGLDPALPV